MADNEALDESATGTSDDGGGGDLGDFSQSPPPAQQTAPQNGNTAPQAAPQPQNGQAQPSPQTPPPAPKVTGKAAFMGNLLRTILSGVQNSTGNPNNAFDRGFQQASPQVQQQ